jgi:hypothetical protein
MKNARLAKHSLRMMRRQNFDNRKSSGTGLRDASVLQSPTCCMTIERMTWTSIFPLHHRERRCQSRRTFDQPS